MGRPEERTHEQRARLRNGCKQAGCGLPRRAGLEEGEGVLEAGLGAERHETESEDREQRHHGFDGASTCGSEHRANLPARQVSGKFVL